MSDIRFYTRISADELVIEMVVAQLRDGRKQDEVSLTFSTAEARDLGIRLIQRAALVNHAAATETPGSPIYDRIARLLAELRDDHWPHGATVKLAWTGPGHHCKAGWAKRNPRGQLVSVYSGFILDAEMWSVVEERADGHP